MAAAAATTAVVAAGGSGKTVARRRRIDGFVMRAKCNRRARRHGYLDTADRVAGDGSTGGGGKAGGHRVGKAE